MAGNRYITDNLLDNGIELLYKGKAIPTIQDLGTVLFVSPKGDDGLAVMGRADRPFKTIQAALNACNVLNGNYFMKVFPGVYTENITVTLGSQRNVIMDVTGGVTITASKNYVFHQYNQTGKLTIVGDRYTVIERTGDASTSTSNAWYDNGAIYEFGSMYYLIGIGKVASSYGPALSYGYSGLGAEDCNFSSVASPALNANYANLAEFKRCSFKATQATAITTVYSCLPRIEDCYIDGQVHGAYLGNSFDGDYGYIRRNHIKAATGIGLFIGGTVNSANVSKTMIVEKNRIQSQNYGIHLQGVTGWESRLDLLDNRIKVGTAAYSIYTEKATDKLQLKNNSYNKAYSIASQIIENNNNSLVPDLFVF